MKSVPTIEKYMSTNPHTVGADQPLSKASQMMGEFQIRHLPVLEGGKLVGIISDRDLKFVESFRDVNPETTKISDACTEDIYMVSPKAPLTEVCAEMSLHKYGSVLVVDNHKLVGIFTWIDALKAFNELLHTRLSH